MTKIFNRAKIKSAKALVVVYLTVLMIHRVDQNASTPSMIITNHALARLTISLNFNNCRGCPRYSDKIFSYLLYPKI